MPGKLNGKRIAFLATDGVEQVELTAPWQAAQEEGATTELVSLKSGQIYAMNHDDKGQTFKVDRTCAEVTVDDYDALVIPGGVRSPDRLRMDRGAVALVSSFADSGKPLAVICHGPWMLVEADVVRGRTVTSWPSLRTDIRNAGGTWVDEQVHVDQGLVTSRKPDDLPAFCSKLVEEVAEGRHTRRQLATAGSSRGVGGSSR